MATLDDKILGEKLQYYYSSSEDEDDDKEDEDRCCGGKDDYCEDKIDPSGPGEDISSGTTHTGPKGVIEDWRRYKQLETEKRKEQSDERSALAKRLALTCRTYDDDLKDKEKGDDQDELENLGLDDAFLRQYREQRMREMTQQLIKNRPIFGSVLELTRQNYVDAIDNENKTVCVVVHVYGNATPGCEALDGCFQCLAQEYPNVKFCRAAASAMQVSHSFCQNGLPAILVYKAGQLIGNFIKVTEQLGDDFYAVEVEAFLQDHGLLPNKEEKKVIRGGGGGGGVYSDDKESGDSDLDLD